MTKSSRSLLERAASIFQFLENQSEFVFSEKKLPKSAFQKIGISPGNIDQWLALILFIQNQPRVRITKDGKKTYVEQLDNKLMLHLRSKYLNPTLTYIERQTAITMYLKLLTNVEKAKGEEIDWESLIDDPPKLKRPVIYKIIDEAKQQLD